MFGWGFSRCLRELLELIVWIGGKKKMFASTTCVIGGHSTILGLNERCYQVLEWIVLSALCFRFDTNRLIPLHYCLW